jgi:hypothetical protein
MHQVVKINFILFKLKDVYKQIGITLHLAYCKRKRFFVNIIAHFMLSILFQLKNAYFEHLKRTRFERNSTMKIFILPYTTR